MFETKYRAIVIGVSSGGMKALKYLFSALPLNFSIPFIVVQHIGAHSDNRWIRLLEITNGMLMKEPDEKEMIAPGTVYIAPANYHLLIEKNLSFSLTVDEKVNYARPSIDVLFESAAEAYQSSLIGIILTGSNADGTNGLKQIKLKGGLTIAQDPATAESSYMPASAIAAFNIDHILPLEGIVQLLISLEANLKPDKQNNNYGK